METKKIVISKGDFLCNLGFLDALKSFNVKCSLSANLGEAGFFNLIQPDPENPREVEYRNIGESDKIKVLEINGEYKLVILQGKNPAYLYLLVATEVVENILLPGLLNKPL